MNRLGRLPEWTKRRSPSLAFHTAPRPMPLAEMRKEALPPQLQQIIDKALAKEPKNRYQKIAQMRDELRAVMQQIAGAQLMPGDTFAPSHADGSAVKRVLNWFTGKSTPETSSAQTPSGFTSSQPSFTPDISMTATGVEKKSGAILPFKNLGGDDN